MVRVDMAGIESRETVLASLRSVTVLSVLGAP